eukprot:11863079-Prorocentrum_lima.AAC.1
MARRKRHGSHQAHVVSPHWRSQMHLQQPRMHPSTWLMIKGPRPNNLVCTPAGVAHNWAFKT